LSQGDKEDVNKMRKLTSLLMVVLTLVLVAGLPAHAGGILEFLFGSKPKMVQYFSPAVSGSLTARDAGDFHELTFDLDGTGNRVVLNAGIPVESGTLLVGNALPATGDREVKEMRVRLDGDPRAFAVVPPPASTENQEEWLEATVRYAKYLSRRQKATFAGVVTSGLPCFFVVDTSRLMRSAHAIEVFVRQDGKNGLGAATTLPFRVVDVVDEETGRVASQGDLDQAVSEQVGREEQQAQEPEKSAPTPKFLKDWEGRIRDTFKVLGLPGADLTHASVWELNAKDCLPAVLMYDVAGNGLLLLEAFYASINGEPKKFADDGDGIFYAPSYFKAGDTFTPLAFGHQPITAADGSPLSLKLEQGKLYVIPAIYLNGRWAVQ
jgi:hypothetical protein